MSNGEKDLQSCKLLLQLAEQTILNCNNQLAYWRIQTGVLRTKIFELEKSLTPPANDGLNQPLVEMESSVVTPDNGQSSSG